MDLDFSPEQELLRDTVRGVCQQFVSMDVVREMEDDLVGYPEPFWKQLADLDLIGLLLPEQHGGSGMSMLDAVIVYEEFGRALAPSPHFVSSVMSGGVIARAASDAQQAEWLPRIASGDAIVTPAWMEPRRGFGEKGIALSARQAGNEFVLDGTKRHVAYAHAASAFVVLARSDAGVELFLVPADTAGIACSQRKTIASDTQFDVTFTGVTVPDSARLGAAGTGWATWHDAMLDGVTLLAAQAVGGARAALELTVQYAKDRKQFDKPLGAFQAISHYLADAVTNVDGAETLTWEAGWAKSAGQDTERLAPMAKLFATQTYRDLTAMAQQVFGGVGFTLEYDIQLYFRRAKQLQISWWDTAYLETLIAADILD